MAIDSIFAILFGSVLVLILLALAVVGFIWAYYTDIRRKEFLSNLNEHELAIIQKYFACCIHPFKKGDK